MNALAQAGLRLSHPAWLTWLRRELAPFPGREPMTIRLVVTVTIVTAVSLALQVPQLAYSAFFVFFVTKENRVLTSLTGVIMICGATIATALNLLLYSCTFDYPELRVPVMAGLIFSAMFLSRTFVIGPLGFVIGFFSALMQTLGENAPDTDALVRGQLWLWMAIVYPIALTVFINQILLPADPWKALVISLNIRLDAAATALERILKEGSAGGQTNRALLNLAVRGSTNMLGLLNFAEMKDPRLKHRHPFLVETVAAAAHLASAAATLEFRETQALSAEDLLCARELLSDIGQLKTVLPETGRVLSSRTSSPPTATLPQLRELQFAIESFRDSLVRGASDFSATNIPKTRKPLFNADAFTNPAYVRFALKVTLAAMICYLVYSALKWPGISTSFVTCCFVALGNTGATIYKSWLRFFGCLAGGLLGYLAIFFLIPNMINLTSLVLLTAAGSALAGWIASGSERIAYAGLQFAFAFYLSIFQGFEPEANLSVIRDRLFGILMGTIVSAIVFRYVWPEHAADQLRPTLARVLRNVSQLVCLPKPDIAVATDAKNVVSLHASLAKDLDSALVLSEQVGVENVMFHNPKGFSPAVLEHLTVHVQSMTLITTALLRRTKLEEWQRLDKPAQSSESELRVAVSDYLQRTADSLESGGPIASIELDSACKKWNLAVANIQGNDRPRLVRRLVDQVSELA
jgi:multidrug resistance protein MdtO